MTNEEFYKILQDFIERNKQAVVYCQTVDHLLAAAHALSRWNLHRAGKDEVLAELAWLPAVGLLAAALVGAGGDELHAMVVARMTELRDAMAAADAAKEGGQ